MNLKNTLKFVGNPKKYISDLVILHSKNRLEKITEREFLIPIDKTESQDVFIAGFPKSGNTWMQSLVAGLLYGIDTQYMPDKLAQEIVPDVHARKYYKRFGTINFFKTHHLPQPHYKKVIYLVRDGRDAMVSYYHFNQKLGIHVSMDKMIKEGKHVFPSKWHQHVQQWQNNPYNAEIITIRYEDLQEQPLIELKKICEFVSIKRSDELLTKVIEGNRIDKMRARVKETGGMGNKMWTGNKGQEFFRKGKTGDYVKEMSPEQIDYFNTDSASELKYFKYVL
ncbi:sulfotransferase domain-containing protein [Saccharicrinis sp. 156]|uniref:sulfotransferase domain-containing protein n=1 Tax=Saccharicrinis sp. 156 TaxID=3417574 RepID=UPI003D35820E